MRLKNKFAVIIGGGQAPGAREVIGNGRATAILFAQGGLTVCCVDRDLKSAQQTSEIITETGGTAMPFTADDAGFFTGVELPVDGGSLARVG
ncbi:MAG: hypothetical protein ACJ0UT_01540 [Candidatus Latescibacterota bacterium]